MKPASPGASSRPWRSTPTTPRFAAIDIGSDTVHLLIADVPGQAVAGAIDPVHSESELIELGRVVDRRGRITVAAEADVARTLARMVRRARKSGATILIAATEASRRAANGQAVLGRLSTRVGVPIRLLSPTREAQLGFGGVRPELPVRGELVVIDSGGASTEVSLTRGRAIANAVSLPVGAALLAAALPGDPPAPLDWALTSIRIGATLGLLPVGRPRHAFATGGTAHGLLALSGHRYRHGSAQRVDVTVAQLERTAASLLTRPSARIGAASGIEPGRVALLAPGVLILAAILRHYQLDVFHVLAAGVREGMIRSAAVDADGWWLDSSTTV
ncbi:MAG: Ppx/GppA phosphatase family protein [Candidatus Limnocylindrales bacterium]